MSQQRRRIVVRLPCSWQCHQAGIQPSKCVVKILKQNAVAVSEHQKASGLSELETNLRKTIPSAKLFRVFF